MKAKGHFSKVAHDKKPHHPPIRANSKLKKRKTSTKNLVNNSMYKIRRKAQSCKLNRRGRWVKCLTFSWELSQCYKGTQKQKEHKNENEMFSDRNAPVTQHRSHGERRHRSRRCVVKPRLNESSEGEREVRGKKNASMLFVKC